MNITKNYDESGKKLTLIMSGALDENSADKAEKELSELMTTDVENISLDLSPVNYISSIGVKALIVAHKRAVKYGKIITVRPTSMSAGI